MLVAKMNNKGSFEVLEIAKKYGIDNILNHLPNEISGGQKQRVSIARAILLDRPVLICDEPTGNLDSENTKIVCEILKNESKNRLVIVVSHNLEEFRSISDRIIKISDGIITSDEVINKIDGEINTKENKIIFGIKEKIYLVTKFFKKNIVKHIFTMITLFLSFLILLTSLNILLNSKAKLIYEAYKDDEVIDFSRYENVMDSAVPLSKEELEKYSKNSEALFYDHKMYVDDIIIERIYVASKTKREMLYGENTIKDNEILISDYVATELSDNIETLIGTTFDNYTIKGIYKTNYNKIVDLKDEYDTTCFNSIYMTENTFKYKNIDNTVGLGVYTKLKIDDNRKTSVVYQEEMTDSFTSVLYGEKTELKDNEIAIDLKTAQQYSDNPIELLGKTIELKFVNILDVLDTKESIEEEGIFKCVVKYIFKDRMITDYNDIIVSRSLFKDIYGNYRASFSHNANGISLYNPSINKINSMLNNDLDDYTYKADKISLGLSWIKPFSYIGLGLGGIMLIISIILMVNLVHIIFEKDKRTQGVLISFGVSKKEVARMYMLDILINVFLSFIISLVLEIFALMGFNKVLHTYINKESSIYYSFSSFGIILITIIFLMLIIYRRVLKKILKKQIVDIIYER